MTKSTWRKVDESVVYMNGILGECPPRGETHLSPIDLHPLPRRTTIAWAFVYGERIDEKKFTRVLSQVLRDFPLLAGRFSGNNSVLHNNAGVPVVVGKDTQRATEWEEKESSCNEMDLQRVYKGKDAIISFRITHLLDGGSSLGITVPHAIVDGRSLMAFLSALSNQFKEKEYPKPGMDRRLLTSSVLAELCTEDEIEADDAKLDVASSVAANLSSKHRSAKVHPSSSSSSEPADATDLASSLSVYQSFRYLLSFFWQVVKSGGKLKTAIVRICKEEIARIKDTAAEKEVPTRISRNDIAVAYSWILMRKLQDKLGQLQRSDRLDKSRMLFAADLRVGGRMQNMSENYFGNAVLAVDVSGPARMSMFECAAAVRKAVSNLKPARTKKIMKTVWKIGQESAMKSLPALVTALPAYHDCFVTSWQFPFEELTFGESGPPIGMYPGMLPRCPWTAIVMGDEKGGTSMHLTLPSEAHDLLQSDPSIQSHMDRASLTFSNSFLFK